MLRQTDIIQRATALRDLPGVEVTVFEPRDGDDRIEPKGAVPALMPSRAALIALMDRYIRGLMEPVVTLLEVQKLCYFLQLAGQPLRLRFDKGLYGPYAPDLRFVLRKLEGHYIAGYGDGGQKPTKPLMIVPGALEAAANVIASDDEVRDRFDRVTRLVEGFETPAGLELLATAYWGATQYKNVLATLARRDDIVGTLFLKAEGKINDPAKLQRLVGLIGGEEWMGLNVDVKGTIYEGLLERNAGEVKSGAGQYFTPRPLIEAITALVDPDPRETVHDPAVGTGGFLLAAYAHMRPKARDRAVARALREEKLSGTDIVADVVRLCAMNLYLHGIGGALSPVTQKDALMSRGNASYDVILTNPPFGKRQSFRSLELALDKFRSVAAKLAEANVNAA